MLVQTLNNLISSLEKNYLNVQPLLKKTKNFKNRKGSKFYLILFYANSSIS